MAVFLGSVADRFYVKSNFGHWSVMDGLINEMVVGYSKKADAEKTAAGLNSLKNRGVTKRTINKLRTMEGYGMYLK